MPRKLVAANWKENPRTEKGALALFRAVTKIKPAKGVAIAVYPPFVYLERISEIHRRSSKKRNVILGAQDIFWEEKGPYTSEVGPRMLRSLGVRHAIVGHSERRKWLKETDQMINKKIRLAAKDGVGIILCVGEALAVRRKGVAAARKFAAGQLAKDLAGIAPSFVRAKLAVAYEPIWAIGTGRYDRPEDAAAMADVIKETVKKRNKGAVPLVLYGGSVNARNVADYVRCKNIDGALVGGASLKAKEFKNMVAVVAATKK